MFYWSCWSFGILGTLLLHIFFVDKLKKSINKQNYLPEFISFCYVVHLFHRELVYFIKILIYYFQTSCKILINLPALSQQMSTSTSVKSVRTISSGVVFSSSSEKSGSRFAKPKSSSLRFTLLSATNLRIKTELIKFRFKKKEVII